MSSYVVNRFLFHRQEELGVKPKHLKRPKATKSGGDDVSRGDRGYVGHFFFSCKFFLKINLDKIKV